jgi:hypothetical protein
MGTLAFIRITRPLGNSRWLAKQGAAETQVKNRFYAPAAPPAYELCSAWFLIALSMPEKIIP